jgi:hypothetical protein
MVALYVIANDRDLMRFDSGRVDGSKPSIMANRETIVASETGSPVRFLLGPPTKFLEPAKLPYL